jgi:hypothetical protein
MDTNDTQPVLGADVPQSTETPSAVEPTTPAAVPQPAPSQQAQIEARLRWFEQNYDAIAAQARTAQERLQEYETAAMSDGEKAEYELSKREGALQQRERELAELRYAQELHAYYQQFVPPEVVMGASPAEWQHNVLTHFQQRIKALEAENTKLRGGARPGVTAPKVPVNGGTTTGVQRKTAYQLTAEQREEMLARARRGQLAPADYPPVLTR